MKAQAKFETLIARAKKTRKELTSNADPVLSREQVELAAKSAADYATNLSNRSNRAMRAGSASTKKLRREAFMRLRRLFLKKDKI